MVAMGRACLCWWWETVFLGGNRVLGAGFETGIVAVGE